MHFRCRYLLLSGLLLVATLAAATSASAQAQYAGESRCSASDTPDTDRDSLSDECELALAHRFAPRMMVRASGCNWDARSDRPHGGYFHAVQPVDSVIRIAYLPAYFRDCGWSGIKCWLPWVDCSPHAGDSEAVIVEISADSGSGWRVTGVFLSAHCFGRSSSSCRWYRGRDLTAFQWDDAAPIVWVAEGRNANYPSRSACDAGHRSVDTCDRHDFRYVFPVLSARNIGSRRFPGSERGCIAGSVLAPAPVDPAAMECFWREDAPFRGWQSSGPGVTSYYRYLVDIGEF